MPERTCEDVNPVYGDYSYPDPTAEVEDSYHYCHNRFYIIELMIFRWRTPTTTTPLTTKLGRWQAEQRTTILTMNSYQPFKVVMKLFVLDLDFIRDCVI